MSISSSSLPEHAPEIAPSSPSPGETQQGSSLKKVVMASMIGTAIEWYDFFIFGSMAALLLGPIFFPSDNEWLSTMASMATFAVAFFMRPLGAVVLGHFGDRFGRRKVLVVALLMMGLSTFAIGLLPTYAQIGFFAPVLLIVLRMIQGFALGGEYGGAVLMVVENAKAQGRRGFFGAFLGAASPIGFLLATSVIALTTALTTEEQMTEWAWRVPFLTSAIMVGVGLYIRVKLEESDEFHRIQAVAEKTSESQQRVPFVKMFREHPVEVLKSIMVPVGQFAGYYLTTVFLLSYARNSAGFSIEASNSLVMIAAVSFLVFIFIGGYWSDKAFRWLPMMVGVVGFACAIFFMFPLVDSQSYGFAAIAFAAGLGFMGLLYGPLSTYMAELFSGSVRYTGVSFGYQAASAITGGLTPVISVALLDQTGSWVPVAIYAAVMMAVSVVGMLIRRNHDNWQAV